MRTSMDRGKGALPTMGEMEAFGADGEEAAFRLLREQFSSVIRNPILPYKEKLLEKDFLVVERGIPFVVEIKAWKGKISFSENTFRQEKEDGSKKELKSPVGTTLQFLRELKKYYNYEGDAVGIVAFASPDCTLELPDSLDGVALLPLPKVAAFIRATAKQVSPGPEPFDETRVLRCTRLYSDEREFCKGLLVNEFLVCQKKNGEKLSLDTTKLKFVTVQKRPLLLGYRLFVTFSNDSTGVFDCKDQQLVIGCLDGSFCRFSLGKTRYLVF
ncbi:MAG: NERD domain-containing protein [Clostridia bacterium]|nr:NERD domain-containing protein [Clostridia bacterium]